MKSPPAIIYGCMRLDGDGSPEAGKKAFALLDKAIELGIDTFDHADIYGRGRCEALFGEWLSQRPGARERIVISTKCGIRHADTPEAGLPKRYDFSGGHIRSSVEASLRRLGVERIETLFLHRFDHLLDTDELGEALLRLRRGGQVAAVAVSNFSVEQVRLLRECWPEPIAAHQMEINACDISALFDGRLAQCLCDGIEAQAWSPLAGLVGPCDRLGAAALAELSKEIGRQAACYEIEPTSVMLAWLMRHSARIRPVVGTTNVQRLGLAIEQTRAISYARKDWYRLLSAIRQRPLE